MPKIILPFCFIILSCSGQTQVPNSLPPITKAAKNVKIIFNKVGIWLQYPADSVSIKGDLILLPGWNFSNTKWCDSTEVCQTALAKGYRVIAPQMGQSIYATKYFPETRTDLRNYPTLLWLDSAINFMKDSMGMFQLKNYLLGLSTGARGVALICEKRPGFFHAAAALSGDFNQMSMPQDPLCSLVYGPFSKFMMRWKNIDNPQLFLNNHAWNTPVYLGHGMKDKVVPVAQTQNFAAAILNNKKGGTFNPKADLVLHVEKDAGHTFVYWKSELPAIWSFFEAH